MKRATIGLKDKVNFRHAIRRWHITIRRRSWIRIKMSRRKKGRIWGFVTNIGGKYYQQYSAQRQKFY